MSGRKNAIAARTKKSYKNRNPEPLLSHLALKRFRVLCILVSENCFAVVLLYQAFPYFFSTAAVSSGVTIRTGSGFWFPVRRASHQVESPSQPNL